MSVCRGGGGVRGSCHWPITTWRYRPEALLSGLDAAMLLALRRLPVRQREVIVLRVFLDLDIETTARQLEIAPGTVRAHLSRAITTLRDELALDEHDGGRPMSENDQLIDSLELRELRESLDGIAIPERPALETITARGRARRRRRRLTVTGLTGAGDGRRRRSDLALSGAFNRLSRLSTHPHPVVHARQLHRRHGQADPQPGRAPQPDRAAERLRQIRHPGEGHHRQLLHLKSRTSRLLPGRVRTRAGNRDSRRGPVRSATDDHDRPVEDTRGHRADRRRLQPRHRRAAGQLRAHELKLLHLHQHPAGHVQARQQRRGPRPSLRRPRPVWVLTPGIS